MTYPSLFIGNSMDLELANLAAADGTAITSATVQATIYEGDKITPLSGISWPVTLTYSTGIYSYELPSNLSITEGLNYFVEITATTGSTVFQEGLWTTARQRLA